MTIFRSHTVCGVYSYCEVHNVISSYILNLTLCLSIRHHYLMLALINCMLSAIKNTDGK